MEQVVQQKMNKMALLSDQEYYYKLDNILLSSLEHIRQVFKNRWKSETGEDWVDDKEQLTKFVTGAGKVIHKRAPSFQKSSLETECVAEWDMSLLSFVIQNFGCGQKYEKENVALRQLKNMRNALAHSSTKKLSQQEYLANVESYRASVQALEMEDNKIDTIVELAGITSSLKALEYMNALHEKAEQLVRKGESEEALNFFSEAINVPSLLPINVGTAYEKRAECILAQIKDPLIDQDKCSAALLDAEKAIELSEFSWAAYFLAAQCYRWQNNLHKAIHHYERALAISPAQEKVKDEYDTCKLLAGEHSRGDHMNPVFMPMTLEELMEDLETKPGIKTSKEHFIRLQIVKGKTIKGQDHVFRGHQYMRGWEVPQNFQEAVKYFAKAAKLKNAEGMYNLGVCYQYGHGVKQDVKRALEIYREVAVMDIKTPGDMIAGQYNEGVASAQHALGLLYGESVGVERNYILAAYWYKRAMENGVGQAANNLGHLYSKGLGMPQDEKMAEFCWKEAVNLRSASAPASLMHYYMQQMEPEKAADMLRIGREMENTTLLKVQDGEFNRLIALIKSHREKLEPEVIQFEQVNNLSSKGLTFKERMTRRIEFLQPNGAKYLKVYNRLMSNYQGEEKSWGGQTHHQKFTNENICSLILSANQGSITASNILKTLSLFADILKHLSCYTEGNKCFAEEIVDLLYNCVILELHVIQFNMAVFQTLKSMFQTLFEKNGHLKGEKDMKIRLCYAVLLISQSMKSEDMYGVEVLKEGIRRYPDNAHYYDYLSNAFGSKRMHGQGRFYAEEGLKVFPENADLLFCYAKHLPIDSDAKASAECVEVLKRFLNLAPKDHRKYPEAYYHISLSLMMNCYRLKETKSIPDEMLDQIKAYFKMGQEAEKNQLVCYLPYGESDGKCMVESFLLARQPKKEKPLPMAVPVFKLVEEKSILRKKPYLSSPARKSVILTHRRHVNELEVFNRPKDGYVNWPLQTTFEPKLKQTVTKRMSTLRPITLQEMNPTEDQIYGNRTLDLTIMDELNSYYISLNLIAEDENGDVIRLYVYNVGKDRETLAKFQHGCRIAIVNPYMRIGLVDNTHGIRVDEPKCVVFLEKVENMCRFCGEGNAQHKCSKCKRPYCSRECQVLDWKEMNHKLICSLKW